LIPGPNKRCREPCGELKEKTVLNTTGMPAGREGSFCGKNGVFFYIKNF